MHIKEFRNISQDRSLTSQRRVNNRSYGVSDVFAGNIFLFLTLFLTDEEGMGFLWARASSALKIGKDRSGHFGALGGIPPP